MTRFFVALSLALALSASAMPTKREGVNGDLQLASQVSHTAAHILDSAGTSLDKMNPGKFEASPETPSEPSSSNAFVNPPPETPSDAPSPEVPAAEASSPSGSVNPPPEEVDEFPTPTPSEAVPSSSAAAEPTPSESAPATESAPAAGTDALMGMFNKLPVIGALLGGGLGGLGGGAGGAGGAGGGAAGALGALPGGLL